MRSVLSPLRLVIKIESLVRARRAFRTHFNVPRNRPIQSNRAINTWTINFVVSGSTSKKRGGSQKTVRTPENIERVREAFERNPRRSAVRHATTLGITPRSVRRILRNDLHYTRTRSRSFRLWIFAIMWLEYAFVRKCWTSSAKTKTLWITFGWVMKHIFM